MMHRSTRLAAACVLFTALPSLVQAQVPSAQARSAAQVRELALMLSSVALRCKAIGISIQSDYDIFEQRHKDALARADVALRQHFDVRTKADLHGDIDRFQIRVLNFYGTGRTDQHSCGKFSGLMKRLGDADSDGKFVGTIAAIMVPEPMLGAGE